MRGGRLALSATLLGAFALTGCGDDITATPDAAQPIDAAPLTPAVLSISPPMNDFGSVDLNTNSAAATFTITNTGEDVSGSITPVITGANASDFTFQNGCSTLQGGGTCNVTVTFRPTTAGSKNASLVVSGSPGGSVMSALLGAGQTAGTLSISNALSFPTTTVGQTSTSQTFTVTNSGTATTSALTVSKSGSNPGDFTVASDTCGGMTLAGGATCTFQVTFAPTSAGMKSASFVVAATQGGTVTGTASGTAISAAALALTPMFQDFGTVTVGSSSSTTTFTITNNGGTTSGAIVAPTITGTDASQFTVSSNNCAGTGIAAGATCSIVVRFNPTSAGPKSATLQVTSTGSGSPSATLTGTGATPGQIVINNSPATFSATVGTPSASQQFTVTNTGGTTTGSLATALGGAAPDQYQIVAGGNGCQGATLGAGQTCTISVQFNPTSGGVKNATLTVTGAPGGTTTAILNGTATSAASIALTPTSLDFGSVVTGSSSSFQTFTLTNNGGQAAPVAAVSIGGTNATQFNLASPNPCPTALAAGASCTIMVRFSPTNTGLQTATLTATAGAQTVTSALSGTGVGMAALAVDPTIIQFPVTLTGNSSTSQSFQVTNNGSQTTGPLTITSTGPNAGDFTQTNNCTTLIANASCTVNVTFSPTARGTRTATIQVSGTPGGTVGVAVRGDSLPRIELLSPTSPFAFADSVVDPTAPNSQLVTVRNNTNVQQTLALTETDTTNSFDVTNNGCNGAVAAGASCTFTVTFDPTVLGALTATYTVRIAGTTGANDAATLTVTGNGTVTTLTIRDLPVDTTPTSRDFGNRSVGTSSAPVTFEVTNTSATMTGTLAVDLTSGAGFQIDQNGCSGIRLAGGATCTITVIFAPTAVAAANATLVVRTSQGAPVLGGSVSATLTGTGTAATPIANPTALMFGTQFAGDTGPNTIQTVVITNPNDTSTSLSFALTNDPRGGFSILTGAAGDCGTTLAAGAQCNLRVKFTPALPTGDRTGSIRVTQSSGQTATVSLLGSVSSAFALVANPTPFGNVVVGQTATQTVMVRNVTTNQTINSFTIDAGGAPYFVLDNTCTSLAPGATCSFTLQFAPTTAGAFPRSLTVNGGTTGSITTAITGTGVTVAALSVAPASGNFGSEVVGQNGTTQTFTVTNNGQQASGVPTVASTNTTDFSIQSNTCTVALAQNATCAVTVRFNPTTAGAKTGTLSITATPGGAAANVALSGTGIAPGGVRITPGSASFTSTTAGQVSANQTFTVTNTSTTAAAALAINDNSADFEVRDAANGTTCTGTLAAGASCTIAVRFTPTSAGPKQATLQVSGPTVASLTGTGLSTAQVVTNLGGTFANPQPIAIPIIGQATPFPSNITVTGVNGLVDTVTLRLVGLSHTFPNDLGMEVVSPSGDVFEFFAGTCGSGDLVNANITFDDNAAAQLPANNCTAGTFRPTVRTDRFGAGTGDAAAPAGTATFANSFRGTQPNGTWSLYVQDFTNADSGAIAGGWELTVNPQIAFGEQTINTASQTRTVTFTNLGQTTAAPITSTQTGPNGDNFVIVNGCQGVALAPGASCDVQISFRPLTTGDKATQLNFTGPITQVLSISGTGVNPANISITPSVTQVEGSRAIGDTDTTATQFTVANSTGSAPTSPITFTLSNPANYTLDPASTCDTTGAGILQPGASCVVGVFFNPTQLGTQATTLTVAATNGGTVTGSITGTGTNALVTVTTSPVQFGNQAVGTASNVRTITFRNDADSPTTLIQTQLQQSSGMDFSIVDDDCGGTSLAANGTCDIDVIFVPSGTMGARSANLVITAQVGTTTTSATAVLNGTATP